MKAAQRGFTLVELLIGIAILALLMSMIFGGVHLAARNIGRQSARLDRSYDVSVVQLFLRAQLADAHPLNAFGRTPRRVNFDGARDRVEFVSPAVETVRFGGLQRLAIILSPQRSGAGNALVAVWQPYRESSNTPDTERRTVLLENVQEVGFSYFGASAPAVPPSWADSWREKSRLPFLLRLRVVFSDGERMPDLTVALRLSSSAAEQDQDVGRY
jgi:general secretion pathway protein J